jgi:hypothetical protein
MAGRFQQSLEYQPTTNAIASSAGNEWSFTETVIKEIEEANAPRRRRVYRYALYAVKRHLLNLDGIFIRVAHGIPNCDPTILPGYCAEDGRPIGNDTLQPPPPGARTEIVPRIFEGHYRRNCRAALQDFSGISSGGTHRAFPEMFHFQKCIELSREDGLREPTRPGVTKIPVTMEDDLNIWDCLVRERFSVWQSGSPAPLRHPGCKRYVYIDLATRSTAGIAVCHLIGRPSADANAASTDC